MLQLCVCARMVLPTYRGRSTRFFIFFFHNTRALRTDLGGHKAARKLWREYFASIDGIVFMVDAVEQERFAEGRQVRSVFPSQRECTFSLC